MAESEGGVESQVLLLHSKDGYYFQYAGKDPETGVNIFTCPFCNTSIAVSDTFLPAPAVEPAQAPDQGKEQSAETPPPKKSGKRQKEAAAQAEG
jgi:hypothetical protein